MPHCESLFCSICRTLILFWIQHMRSAESPAMIGTKNIRFIWEMLGVCVRSIPRKFVFSPLIASIAASAPGMSANFAALSFTRFTAVTCAVDPRSATVMPEISAARATKALAVSAEM